MTASPACIDYWSCDLYTIFDAVKTFILNKNWCSTRYHSKDSSHIEGSQKADSSLIDAKQFLIGEINLSGVRRSKKLKSMSVASVYTYNIFECCN
jgi:hypothetical protein